MASPGTRIQQAREAHGLSVRDLAATTRIPHTSLTHIEQDRYEELPAEVFVRGFLRNISRELKLDSAEIIDAYEEHTGRKHKSPVEQVAQDDDTPMPVMTTPKLGPIPELPQRVKGFSFDNVVEVVGSTKPSLIIGSLVAILVVAMGVAVFSNSIERNNNLSYNNVAPTQADSHHRRWILNGRSNSNLMSAGATLDLATDDVSAE